MQVNDDEVADPIVGAGDRRPRSSAVVLQDGQVVEETEWDATDLDEAVDLALGAIHESLRHVSFIWLRGADRRASLRDERPAAASERPQFGGGSCRVSITTLTRESVPGVRIEAEAMPVLPYGLSAREMGLTTMIAAGMTNREIAESLHLSLRTVTTHLANIMGKLSVTNRTEIAATAFTEGLLSLPLAVESERLLSVDVGRIHRSRGTRSALPLLRSRSRPRQAFLTIGSLVPRHGRAAQDAVEMARGAELAIEEVNASNGVHGTPVRLRTIDVDVDDQKSVRHAMHRLLSDGVAAITSGYLRHQIDAMELSSVEGVPFLHSSASSSLEGIAARDRSLHRHVFQCCPTDASYAPTFVRFMSELRDGGQWIPRTNRLVIVQQSDWDFVDYGIEAARFDAQSQGWDLQVIEAQGNAVPDRWSRAASEAVRRKPAAIMLANYFIDEHSEFFSAVDRLRSDALRYAIYAPSLPDYRRRLGAVSEGLLWATTTGTYSDRLGHSFAKSFTQRFGVAPGRSHAGIAYDRINLLTDVWLRSADPLNFEDVATRLSSNSYRGVNGAYHFATPGQGTLALTAAPDAVQNGETVSADPSLAQAHTIFQIRGRRNLLVSPHTYAVSEFVLPPWAK